MGGVWAVTHKMDGRFPRIAEIKAHTYSAMVRVCLNVKLGMGMEWTRFRRKNMSSTVVCSKIRSKKISEDQFLKMVCHHRIFLGFRLRKRVAPNS